MPQTIITSSRHPNRTREQQAPAAPPASVPDTSLGLSREDIATLRQHQQLAHQHAQSSRGSNASSQGRLLLDPASLTLLGRHLERVMQAIEQRIDMLNHATEMATQTQFDRAGNAIEMADAQIARLRLVIQQTEDLETEFEKIRRIQEIVRSFKTRVEELERRLG